MTYWVYIIANDYKTVLYTGITNDLPRRLNEHAENIGTATTFTGKYRCRNLLYCQGFGQVDDAIRREKQIKNWSRKKKIILLRTVNPEMEFLNPSDFR